ncbi:MAG: tetratricopeptide repeat protein [Treponema sp.]|jgi:tetratricopeptide (TPR) repeat protein|nr:tetratricopeptide repeat protein [Treponema sp.]
MIKNGILGFVLFCFGAGALFAQSAFSRGEELFIGNEPQEALAYLEAAAEEDPSHVKTALYLAMAYEQLGRLEDALGVYRRILPQGGGETARIAFNLGNALFNLGDPASAVLAYTQAVEADPSYAPAYLNRANSLVKTGSPGEALVDYELYLSLEPQAPQRSRIEELILFIREESSPAGDAPEDPDGELNRILE